MPLRGEDGLGDRDPCPPRRPVGRTGSRPGTLTVPVAARHPGIRKVWVDDGYRRHLVECAAVLGIDREITAGKPGNRGFPKRWAGERAYDWLMHH